jgi:hypothetical protein
MIFATRKDLDEKTGEEGKDYYTRIKDVIERINLRKTHGEASLADKYRRAISKPNYRTRLSPLRRKTGSLSTNSPKLDLSWKDGRKRFPKKSSMIGDGYQVSAIPSVGSYEKNVDQDDPQ